MERLPEKNNGFQSIQEYLSNIKPVTSLVLDKEIDENDFLDILDILERYCKSMDIKIPYGDFVSIEAFYSFLANFERKPSYYIVEGIQSYNKKKKQLEFTDMDIQGVNNTIFNIWIGPFLEIEGHINQKVFDYVGYMLGKRYNELQDTMYQYVIDWFPDRQSEWDDEELSAENESEKLHMATFLFLMEALFRFCKIEKKPKFSKKEYSKLSKDEKQLLKIAEGFSFYENTSGAEEIMEVDTQCEAYEYLTEYDDSQIHMDENYVIDEGSALDHSYTHFYNGQNIISLWESDFMCNEYESWLNDSSNNGHWDFFMRSKIVCTKNRLFIPKKKIRDRVVKFAHNQFDFNKLTQKMYERIKGSGYETYWGSDDLRERLLGISRSE